MVNFKTNEYGTYETESILQWHIAIGGGTGDCVLEFSLSFVWNLNCDRGVLITSWSMLKTHIDMSLKHINTFKN